MVHFRIGASGLIAAAALAVLVAGGSPALGASRALASQSGTGYYAGKTLTFIAPGNPQSAAALWAREVAPLMARFLHARVNVFDDAAGEPLGGQAQLASAATDGLTFGGLDLPQDFSLAISHAIPLPFKQSAFELVGVAQPVPNFVWSVSSGFAKKNFAALLSSHTKVLIPDTTGDLDNVIIRSVDGIFGVNAHIISGYSNAAEVVFGFERGDAPFAGASLSNFLPLIQAGKARPVLLLNPVKGAAARLFRGVPTLGQFAAQHRLGSGSARQSLAELIDVAGELSGNSLAVPVGVAPSRVAELSAAFGSAMASIDPGGSVLAGTGAAKDYSAAIRGTASLSRFLPAP